MKVGIARLIELQDGVCAYCSRPFIGRGNKHPHAPSLDHVWPRAYGRTKAWNVLAVHYRCNHTKGKRRPNGCEQLMLAAINLKRPPGCAGHPSAAIAMEAATADETTKIGSARSATARAEGIAQKGRP